MLTAINPGTAATSSDVWMVAAIIAFSVALAIIFVGIATVERPGRRTEALQVWLFAATVIAIAAAIVFVAVGFATASNGRSDYRADVQSWLSSEYGIDVTSDETETLVNRDEFGVELDGEIVAIQLIDGSGGNLQVKEVGGHVIDPSHGKTSGK